MYTCAVTINSTDTNTNIGNTNLTIPEETIRTLNLTGDTLFKIGDSITNIAINPANFITLTSAYATDINSGQDVTITSTTGGVNISSNASSDFNINGGYLSLNAVQGLQVFAPQITPPPASIIRPLGINSNGNVVSGSMSPWVLADVTVDGGTSGWDDFGSFIYFRYNTERLEFKGHANFLTGAKYFSSFRITNVPSMFYSSNLNGHSFFKFINSSEWGGAPTFEFYVMDFSATNALKFFCADGEYGGNITLSFEQISIKI